MPALLMAMLLLAGPAAPAPVAAPAPPSMAPAAGSPPGAAPSQAPPQGEPAPPAEAQAAPAPAAPPAALPGPSAPVPLPPPAQLPSPIEEEAAPPTAELPPPEVVALLPPGHRLVEARKAELDGGGTPEWILVAAYVHPTRYDYGPRSAEWRPGQRIESRATHELLLAGRAGARWKVVFQAELRGSERQPLFVETLADSTGKRGRYPVVITGARACSGGCGPVEVHHVVWDPASRAFGDYAYVGAEFAVVTPDGGVELWFADRREGDPICCPSAYTVTRVGVYRSELDVVRQRTVAADKMRRVLPPGGLILRGEASLPAR